MLSHKTLANAVRALSMDAVERAKSGHPGMPMGMADIAEVLWNDFLSHNPNNPNWWNRDRFVLSNGHGSMMQYSLLHLAGYDLSIEDLKNFRQLHSRTPGHPEVSYTPGIETTTGPLGQGLGNAVGMAIAEKVLSEQFNRPEFNLIDHYTYVFCGDGCLMEGVSHEVCSFAGTLGLGKLIAFWDDNGISIDGEVKGWFTDNTPERFRAYNWHVIENVDGHDVESIHKAIEEARKISNKPTLICCKTTIGFGSPNKAGLESSHGSPLGEEEVALARKELGWAYPPFIIPDEIYAAWNAKNSGTQIESEWQSKFEAYKNAHPALAAELERRMKGDLPADWEEINNKLLRDFVEKNENIATRKASKQVLDVLGPELPEFLGGSADLTGSNLTLWDGCKTLSHDQFDANYIHYGVREFGMTAIMNGIALYGGFIPYGGTFLVFYTYAANAVRMAALMKQRVILVYSHDSIGLGEDGPTHQPVEQIAALRATPNMAIWRPCDTVETAIAWKAAIERFDGPTALLLSRQGLPMQVRDEKTLSDVERGAYYLVDCEGDPDCIIIATGSEVILAVDAAKQLTERGRKIRVVSMPSIDTFMRQDEAYRESVLPAHIKARIAVEAGSSICWHQFVGCEGRIIGLDRFGESAPLKKVMEFFGFTVENIVKQVEEIL